MLSSVVIQLTLHLRSHFVCAHDNGVDFGTGRVEVFRFLLATTPIGVGSSGLGLSTERCRANRRVDDAGEGGGFQRQNSYVGTCLESGHNVYFSGEDCLRLEKHTEAEDIFFVTFWCNGFLFQLEVMLWRNAVT